MNNEIKEILDRIETASEIFDCLLKPEECTELLDYITNLHQENKTLHENNQNMQEEMARVWKENERLNKEINNKEFVFVGTAQNKTRDFIKHLIKEKNDYKSRCEKAIEYLKECYSQPENIENFMTESEMNYLLNILQNGGDKDENI